MYYRIGIQKISPAQVSKLLNGHAITFKHGSHHKIPVSAEQHKKIHSVHRKGKGVRMTADQYQRDMMRAEGIFDNIGSALMKAYHAVAPAVDQAYEHNKHHLHKIAKNVGHQALHHAH